MNRNENRSMRAIFIFALTLAAQQNYLNIILRTSLFCP
jgi:hypothetical protein